jgi:hypothetical protein
MTAGVVHARLNIHARSYGLARIQLRALEQYEERISPIFHPEDLHEDPEHDNEDA